MKHIQIQPGAIAAFDAEPTPAEIETLRDVAEWFASPIETFLAVNALDIPPAVRARVRECIVKGAYRTAVGLVPDFLQDAFRRIVNEIAYQRRNAGQYIDPDADYMPTAGKADPRQSKNSRL